MRGGQVSFGPHLCDGDPYARLAGGFGIGTTTAWRYVHKVVGLLATLDDPQATIARAARLAYVILDGTFIPIDRLANEKPYCCCPHRATAIVRAILVLQVAEDDR